jgi:acyl-CoA thioester hydrolase
MDKEGSIEQPLLTEVDLTVAMYDIDYNGHVNNIVYVRWLEDMRMAGFEKIASMQKCLQDGYLPVLLKTSIEYKRSIELFQKPKGRIWVTNYTNTTFTIELEISVDGHLCAKAVQTLVFLKQSSMKPTRIPPYVMQNLRKSAVVVRPQPNTLA